MENDVLENQGIPNDIDPFTVFGLANKGISDANRISILTGIKSEFGISAEVPTAFDCIPVLNNMKATFYWFEGDRGEDDIDNLWTVFENALTLSELDTEKHRQDFSVAYDKALTQLGVRWNITMGLYWIRPYYFVNLDSRNRQFLSESTKMPSDITAQIVRMKSVPSAKEYLALCDKCKSALETENYEYKTLPELSYTAWKTSKEENETDGTRVWLITWNKDYWAWDRFAEECEGTKAGQTYIVSWAVSNKKAQIGDEVYLLKLGEQPRGIIGHGTVVRELYEKSHYDATKAAEGKTENAIDVRFDRLINYEKEKYVSQEVLIEKCGAQHWKPQSSGIEIKPEVLPVLRQLWDVVTQEDGWWPSSTEYGKGVSMNEPLNLEAYREWQSWPEKRRQFFLNNALCSECSRAGRNPLTSFADGYTIRKDCYGLIVEGYCSRCGGRTARCCE